MPDTLASSLRIANCLLPIAHCALLIAYCQLPIDNRWLFI